MLVTFHILMKWFLKIVESCVNLQLSSWLQLTCYYLLRFGFAFFLNLYFCFQSLHFSCWVFFSATDWFFLCSISINLVVSFSTKLSFLVGKAPLYVTFSVRPSVCHTSYLRNCTSYDHNFWYTYVKWWYLQDLFFIFFF